MEKTKLPRKDFKDFYKQISEVGSGTYGYNLLAFKKLKLTLTRKVYKVACLKNENKKEEKYWAFKKITYSKDSEGVEIIFGNRWLICVVPTDSFERDQDFEESESSKCSEAS